MARERLSERKLRRLLRQLSSAPRESPRAHRQRLEGDLVAIHRRLHGGRSRPRLFWRQAWAGGVLAVVAVAAGALPVRHPVETGALVVLELPPGRDDVPEVGELLAIARELAGSPEVSVSVSRESDGAVRILAILLGGTKEASALGRELRERDPRLRGATIRSVEVVASVRVALAELLGGKLFGLEIEGLDVLAARRSILQSLTAGAEGAEVQVSFGPGERRIEISLPRQDAP